MKRFFLASVALYLSLTPSRGQDANFVPRLLDVLPARAIGPANMSGRVVEVAVVEKRPSTLYVASASGGLWKTVNNGGSWEPVFDEQATLSLGAVAVSASDPKVVWVGTGEANARNSVSPGDGVYKSTDGCQTWKNMGLRDTQHVGRIVIHPLNPDIVYAAALGHLWGPNKERGLFKTTDGGRTWRCVKFINEDTGFIDLVMDPSDPDTLYAAAYQVRRDGFAGGNPSVQTGPGSGLFRTEDGGRTWQRLTEGLPERPLGRCGLCVYRKDPRVVYAVVQTDRTATLVQGQAANLNEVVSRGPSGKQFRRRLGPDDGGIFRSDDKGKTWKQVNSLVPRPFYYGQIRVDPNDDRRLYVLGIALHLSLDGGRTFRLGNAAAGTHGDYHALWIDPADSAHLVLGCDGGLNFSYDRARSWEHLKNLPISQFYAVAADMRRPYRVYGGLQDNGSWGGPSATFDVAGITFADWFNVLPGDGFYFQADPADPDTVYAEMQWGRLRRVSLKTGRAKNIQPTPGGKGKAANVRPRPSPGTPEFRFNWSAPVLLSPHDPRVVYIGGEFLFRSLDRGDTWDIISPDLTRGPPGPSPHAGHTISTLAESPLRPGLLYVGTDDGRLHVSRDGGRRWTDLSKKIPMLPPERTVSRVVCSAFAEGTAYVTIDRHRQDDRRPYVFKTTDYGESWARLSGNLPDAPVYVIREDPRNRSLLYVGTESGLYVSCDGGGTWHAQRQGVPAVAVHDLLVHPRERELVIGTHGRGIYLMDVAPLQELSPAVPRADAYLFDVKPAPATPRRRVRNWDGARTFLGENPPDGAVLYYTLRQAAGESLSVSILNARGDRIARLKLGDNRRTAGPHRLVWDLSTDEDEDARVPAGEYVAVLQTGRQTLTKRFRVE
jgi:photosystem II stability/assembly factor-like uncharacterized protein